MKNRHPERNKETGDLLKSKKTCPEETVYQIGTLDNHVPPELLIEIVTEFMEIANERFGSHVHILNWALHLDESTPHIHERHVFDCENQYGEIAPQQEKALEALGFELPEPEKPVGRKNNRKMTFDSACRVLLFDVAKKHGLQLEEEPEYGGRAYLEKQNHKCYEINYSENPNYADETGGQKSRNGANQEESQKFHYRAVEPQEEGNGRA